ncbi:peptidase inhibitor family I36 protein [Glycomyces sp. A-F 0318]|uniref:peptidase inhibitor family I36 protein n=1 Tax=Glycomyces amatae TaxID=2881355 RepID=UPI001E4AA970|nr:peptidase inhibitor family I36 protein [Glycomyces amatae]MCD0447569.1 peptidase inhibitor family I36 protein [Glycomyces amatae]
MKTRKSIAVAIAAMFGALALLAGTASASASPTAPVNQAATAASVEDGDVGATAHDCADPRDWGYICMWEDPNRGGEKYIHHDPSTDYSVDIDGWDGDNEISSVWNRTSCTLILYDYDDFTGELLKVRPQTYLANLELNGHDNDAESFIAKDC